ncbi:MAG: hypothetical protein JST85_22870 [Acidobacteria bacterium]|nr:hypothetical protein [Acidobacteriota bacterium]
MPAKSAKKKQKSKTSRLPPIFIAHGINRAAEIAGCSAREIEQAIEEGRLKVTRKRAAGRGRGVILILAKELDRFIANLDAHSAERAERLNQTVPGSDNAAVTWDCVRRELHLVATLATGTQVCFHLLNPDLLASSFRQALAQRTRHQKREQLR